MTQAPSKLLFAVLPEIVLPVDNTQWLKVFRTVDLGDVIGRMASDIRQWEEVTGERLDNMDSQRVLTTLPSVYNVMAMDARPRRVGNRGRQKDTETGKDDKVDARRRLGRVNKMYVG